MGLFFSCYTPVGDKFPEKDETSVRVNKKYSYTYGHEVPLRKHAYSNTLKIYHQKMKIFR